MVQLKLVSKTTLGYLQMKYEYKEVMKAGNWLVKSRVPKLQVKQCRAASSGELVGDISGNWNEILDCTGTEEHVRTYSTYVGLNSTILPTFQGKKLLC